MEWSSTGENLTGATLSYKINGNNGLWQDAGYLEVLLSGAPFAIWNRGRRVNVA